MASTNSRRVNAATRPASESSNHRGCSWNRYRALAMAEIRQYLRNKTLLFMAIVFPIGVGLLMLIMGGDGQPANTQVRAAISMEVCSNDYVLVRLAARRYLPPWRRPGRSCHSCLPY